MESLFSDSVKRTTILLAANNEISIAYEYCVHLRNIAHLPTPLMPYLEHSDNESRLVRVENFSSNFCEKTGIDIYFRCQCLAEKILGESAVLFKDKINFRYPGDTGYAPHQDAAAGWDKFASRYVTVAVMLVNSQAENGGFEFPDRSAPKHFFENTNGKLSNTLFNSLDPKLVIVAAGDAIIFDSFTPHQTRPNLTDRIVPHMLLTFNALSEGDFREAYYKEKEDSMKQNHSGYEFRVFEFADNEIVRGPI